VCARHAATGVGASRWWPREGIRESSGARGGQKGAAGRENGDGGGCEKDRMEDGWGQSCSEGDVRGRRKFPSFSKGETIYQPTYFYQPSYSVFTNTLFNFFCQLCFSCLASLTLFFGPSLCF
jgi:hypothetical protein